MLECKNVAVFRERSSAPAVEEFSASFAPGTTTALIGENGSGKTSLALVLAGVLPRIISGRWIGDVNLNGISLTKDGWPLNVIATYAPAEAGVELLLGSLGELLSACPRPIADLAERLPLGEMSRIIRQISAGQRRIMSWLLAAARKPQLLIVDEAFASLDSAVGEVLAAGLRDLPWTDQMTTIITAPSAEKTRGCDATIKLPKTRPSIAAPVLSALDSTLPTTPAVEANEDVTAWWSSDRGQRFRLRNVALRSGEILRVRGEIGAGKTTMLKALGMFPGTNGDSSLARLRKRFPAVYCGGAMYYTSAYSSLEELFGSALRPDQPAMLWKILEPKLRPASLETDPATLSSGQRQLLSTVLMLISTDSPVVCLDEPENMLDADARAILTAVVASRLRRKACIVVATHDDSMVEELSAAAGRPAHQVWIERA